MNGSPWIFQGMQIFCFVGLLSGLGVILHEVRRTRISDKYGIGWFTLLISLMSIDLSHNWFQYLSPETGFLILFSLFSGMALVISFSIQLTEYSRARRKSIQEVALLRYQYQELVKKVEAAADSGAALPQVR